MNVWRQYRQVTQCEADRYKVGIKRADSITQEGSNDQCGADGALPDVQGAGQ